MTTFPLLLALALAPAQAYYGRHSTEAVLRYHAAADVRLAGEASLDALNSRTPDREKALLLLHEQIRHLMGTFQSESFKNEFGYPGALGESYEIRFTDVGAGQARGRKRLGYDFRGTVVFQKEAFHGRDTRAVPVKLPLASDLIYELGVVRGRNRCTDRDFNDRDDFWYYWDPDQAGCPLAGNDTEVVRVPGRLERLPNTQLTYPEYDRLYGDNGNGEALDISVFIGYIRGQDIDSARINRRDEAVAAFHHVDRELEGRGFTLVDRKNHFRVGHDGTEIEGVNYLRRYVKDLTYADSKLHLRVQVLLADTDIESKDETFHHFLVPALERSDIFIYDGHSGLGDNFDLNRLPPVNFNRDKFQLFVFNGCSTYPYVNGMYFRAKGGSKNLDIITAGLPEFANTSGPNLIGFLAPFLEARTVSYQRILSEVEMTNGDSGTYLVGVKGDEDNEWQPQSP